MIASDKIKFIFVHIPKTAGTSVSVKIKSTKLYKLSFLPSTHSSAQEIKDYLGDSFFEYYKFSFIRNPYERMYSLFHFLCYKEMHMEKGEDWDQKEFRNKGFKWWLVDNEWWPPYDKEGKTCHQKKPQSDSLLDQQGNLLIDDIFRYENLEKDLITLGKKIQVNFFPFPWEKKLNKADYRRSYCPETIDFIDFHHKSDIELFNYSFD